MAIRRRIKSWVHRQSPSSRVLVLVAALAFWWVLAQFAPGPEASAGAVMTTGVVIVVLWFIDLYFIWSVATSFWSRTRVTTDEQPAS